MRVYVDNSVIGRLMDLERGIERGSKMLEEDMAILPALFNLCRKKGFQLCSSADAGGEIEKLRGSMPQLTDKLMVKLESFTLLPVRHSIQYRKADDSNAETRLAGTRAGKVDLLVQRLKAFLLSKTQITSKAKREAVEWDAYHLAVCKDNGCEIFLTCDYVSICAYRRLLRQLFGIEVRRPVELMNEILSSGLT